MEGVGQGDCGESCAVQYVALRGTEGNQGVFGGWGLSVLSFFGFRLFVFGLGIRVLLLLLCPVLCGVGSLICR